MMRVVLDTNVLMSALLSARGAPAAILRLKQAGKIELVFSPQTVAEHWRVLHYPRIVKRLQKLGIPLETMETFIKHLPKASLLVPGRLQVAAVKADPSDNIFLACAVEGQANFIISGDHHLKDLGCYEGIPILDPATFINTVNIDET